MYMKFEAIACYEDIVPPCSLTGLLFFPSISDLGLLVQAKPLLPQSTTVAPLLLIAT